MEKSNNAPAMSELPVVFFPGLCIIEADLSREIQEEAEDDHRKGISETRGGAYGVL